MDVKSNLAALSEQIFLSIAIFIGAKKAGRSSEYYPVVSNASLYNKCLASNSSQMQSNISSEYQLGAIK